MSYDYMGRDEWEDEMREATKPRPVFVEVTGYQKEIVLLSIIQAAGGEADSSESKWSWINWFCGDERESDDDDTFNRCHSKGWLHSTHDSDTDHSVTSLTSAGREELATINAKGCVPPVADNATTASPIRQRGENE